MASPLTVSTTTEQASDDSHLADLIALAVAGGLIGRHVARTLRGGSGRNTNDAVEAPERV